MHILTFCLIVPHSLEVWEKLGKYAACGLPMNIIGSEALNGGGGLK